MRLTSVFKVIVPVVITIGFAMLLSAIVSLLYKETPIPLLIGGSSAIISAAICMLLVRNASTKNMSITEGAAIATLAWIATCFFGAVPFYVMKWYGTTTDLSITQCLFESVSGFTTTGASILSDIESLPKGILFWRSFTHWFGGMGIVVLAIAILPKLGIGGMQAFKMESPGPLKSDKLVPRISETGRILYTVYLTITIIEVICLLLVGVNLYDSLVHTFGTVGTGGFSSYNNSVAGLNNIKAEYIIAFFMWLSGVNFGLTYLALWQKDIKSLFKDTEFKTYTLITLIAILSITGGLYFLHVENLSFSEALRYAVFQVPTVLTTTGYATIDYNIWPTFPLIILVILMFIGGSTGSTGGGIKVLRHIVNFKFMKNEILKIIKPDLVSTVKINNRLIDKQIVSSIMALTLIYFTTFLVGGVLLTFFGYDLGTAMTASIANLGNIGPGLNVVGPAGNYSSFHPLSLWILMFEMLLGRLEIYTVIVLFTTWAWKRNEANNQ